MSGPDCDALGIEYRSHIMRVDIPQVEGHYPHLAVAGTVDRQIANLRQPLLRISGKLHFVAVNFIQANFLQEVDRCPKAYGSCNNRCAAFELPGKLFPGRFKQADIVNHFPAEFNRLHGFKQSFLAV
ncbi:hypothetical protein D3C73_1329860 [compost metagenome]